MVFSLGGDHPAEKTLSVNHPVHYGNWKFYLLSYDQSEMEYITVQAKNDPGVPLVMAGIVITVVSVFAHCIVFADTGRKKKKADPE